MDDLKLFFKSEEQVVTLKRTVHVFNTNSGMEFGKKKFGFLTMKREKIVRCEEIKLPKSERGQKENQMKENEMKEKTINKYKSKGFDWS